MDLYKYYDEGRRAQDDHAQSQVQLQDSNAILQMRVQALRDAATQRTAISKYDPNNPGSLDLVAADLAKGGDFSGFMEVQKAKSTLTTQAINQRMLSLKADESTLEYGGRVISTMRDKDTYMAGLDQLKQLGINPQKLGLSGVWERDQPNMDKILQGTMTARERLELNHYVQQRDHQIAQENEQRARDEERARHDRAQEQKDLARTNLERDYRDWQRQQQIMRQAGTEDRIKMARQRLANPTKNMLNSALASIVDDDRFANTPMPSKQAIANLVASRAASEIAKNLSDKNPDWTPQDYEDEVAHQLELGIKNGEIKMDGKEPRLGGIFGNRSTPGGINRQAKPKAGDVVTAPNGQKVRIKSIDPDGTVHAEPL